jgi:hypothetical protein
MLMDVRLFDALIQRVPLHISRRGALLLGIAPLVAAVTGASPAGAKKHGKNSQNQKKNKKNTKPRGQTPPPVSPPVSPPAPPPPPDPAPVDRCPTQVAQCVEFLTVQCEGSLDPADCRERLNPCCTHLGICNTTEFFNCLAGAM